MHSHNEALTQKLLECANACDHCAASCLEEANVEMMAECIRLDMECAAICKATAQLVHLGSNHANAACQLCADICNACAEECEKHDHDHCQRCAAECRHCAEQCLSMTAA